jgi:hypothetical protein
MTSLLPWYRKRSNSLCQRIDSHRNLRNAIAYMSFVLLSIFHSTKEQSCTNVVLWTQVNFNLSKIRFRVKANFVEFTAFNEYQK